VQLRQELKERRLQTGRQETLPTFALVKGREKTVLRAYLMQVSEVNVVSRGSLQGRMEVGRQPQACGWNRL
jgi:hypothetical protein